jgi:hypothetical protein
MYPRYAGFDAGVALNQAHNDWAQWTAEGGLPFLFFMVTFTLLLWKPAVQSIYGVGTLVFLLHAFVDYPMQQRPALGAWFFALAGATVCEGIAGGDDLLRRTRRSSYGAGRGNPAGVPAPGPGGSSRPLQLRSKEPGRSADEAPERAARRVDRPGKARKI